MKSIPFSPFTEVAKKLDVWGEKGIPFVFLVDYSLEKAWAGSEQEAHDLGIFLNLKDPVFRLNRYPFRNILFHSNHMRINLIKSKLD